MAYLAALVRRGVEYRRVDDPSQRHRGIYQVLVLLDRDGHEEEVETRACREAGGEVWVLVAGESDIRRP